MPLAKSKKNKMSWYVKYFQILIILLPLLIIIAGYFLFIQAERQGYEAEKAKALDIRANLDNDIKTLVKLARTVDSYDNITADNEDKINQILPDELNQSDLYVNIEGLIKSADENLVLGNISIKLAQDKQSRANADTVSSDKLAKVSIQLEIAGANYLNLKKLLSAFETNLRLLELNSYAFNPEKGDVEVGLTAFYFKQTP